MPNISVAVVFANQAVAAGRAPIVESRNSGEKCLSTVFDKLRYSRSALRPVGVNVAPPPSAPPFAVETSGSRKHAFIVSTSIHARR